jgi:isopentenyldiphosphate isomerase
MAENSPQLDYPSSLQRYAVTDAEYLRSHPEYDVLCVGAVVFNKEGKLLLVQRAASDKAFPNMWVSRFLMPTS